MRAGSCDPGRAANSRRTPKPAPRPDANFGAEHLTSPPRGRARVRGCLADAGSRAQGFVSNVVGRAGRPHPPVSGDPPRTGDPRTGSLRKAHTVDNRF